MGITIGASSAKRRSNGYLHLAMLRLYRSLPTLWHLINVIVFEWLVCTLQSRLEQYIMQSQRTGQRSSLIGKIHRYDCNLQLQLVRILTSWIRCWCCMAQTTMSSYVKTGFRSWTPSMVTYHWSMLLMWSLCTRVIASGWLASPESVLLGQFITLSQMTGLRYLWTDDDLRCAFQL